MNEAGEICLRVPIFHRQSILGPEHSPPPSVSIDVEADSQVKILHWSRQTSKPHTHKE